MSFLYYNKLFLSLLCLTTIECNLYRFEYNSYEGIDGELKFHYYPATWSDAQEICAKEGAVLASPSNETMKQAMDAEISNIIAVRGVYIGVTKLILSEYFYSIEGVPLDTMPVQWTPGQPDNEGNHENCIAYANGRIADLSCSELLPFVCYRNIEFQNKDDCPEGYIYVSLYNKCYKLHLEPRPWDRANDICKTEGGRLAKFLVSTSLGASVAVPWSHVLNVISVIDYHTENIIFISFVDENDRNWSDYVYKYSDVQTPCAAIRIRHGIRVISQQCDVATPFLCEWSQK